MTGVDVSPWVEIQDAHEAVQDAERTGDEDALRTALQWKQECEERCGAVGAFLIHMAIAHGSASVRKELAVKFGELATAAWEKAQRASRRAKAALAELDAVNQRLRELERRVDNLTPGIGIPEWDVSQAYSIKSKLIEVTARLRILEAKEKLP